MAREGPVAFAADVAAHAGVDFHVLLQRRLRLEPLPAEQAEDGHVRACVGKHTSGELVDESLHQTLYLRSFRILFWVL